MKLFLFIAALLTGVVTALGYPENPSHEVIEKYNRKLENSLKLPTDFAGHFIVDESSIQMLKGKKRHFSAEKDDPDHWGKGNHF